MDFSMSRRMAIAGLLATAGCSMNRTGMVAAKDGSQTFFQRINKPIGLQLYTLGDEVAADLDGVLARVAAIGFRDIQFPNLFGREPAELMTALDRHGLSASAIHLAAMPGMPAEALSMLSPTQRIVDDLGALGVSDAVLPIMLIPPSFRNYMAEGFQVALTRSMAEAGIDGWKRTADLLNEKAAALAPHGIRVGYHNHNIEFAPLAGAGSGGGTGWDILVRETDPALVKFEIDVGWVTAAGLDPVAFLDAHKGRLRWLHVKDVQPSTVTNFALKMDPTEVGSGKQDWARILPAAHAAGVEHFYLEQEAPFTMPRLDAAAKGFAYLNQLKA